MTSVVTSIAERADSSDLHALMQNLGRAAVAAAERLALADSSAKNQALLAAAAAIRAQAAAILAANAEDMRDAQAAGMSGALLDRLNLDAKRVEGMARGLEEVAALADPIGVTIAEWTRPNGLRISRVRVPLGVIGIIYESRPNVTADAGALCLKSGNAAILRGGSDSMRSSRAMHAAWAQGLREAGLPEATIQLIPTRDRAAVGLLLTGLDGHVDVLVPRGGKGLVARVQAEARVPVFAHLEGVCHVYVDKAASLAMAKSIVLNAKMRRTGVCGAAETLLVDAAAVRTHLHPLVEMLIEAGCEVRGNPAVQAVAARVKPASEEDWSAEYLDAIIAAKVVDGVDAAI